MAVALRAGCDLDCGEVYRNYTLSALEYELVSRETVEQAVECGLGFMVG